MYSSQPDRTQYVHTTCPGCGRTDLHEVREQQGERDPFGRGRKGYTLRCSCKMMWTHCTRGDRRD